MSGYPYDEIPASPRRRLAGAARPSANPRIHAIQKPYSRPNSYAGPSSGQELILNGNGNAGDKRNGSPTKSSAPTTRPGLPTSQSQRSFPRSGSESSLFGSLKGLISKPLSWLATPRSAKRDQSTWNAGLDSEDPESPSLKKIRRHSPPRQRERGAYDPPEKSGKGKEREMLPPLPVLSGGLKKLPTTRTAGSTLPHSQSMPYLDPPSNAFSPAKKRGGGGGAITRSRGMNLAALANEEEEEPVVQDPTPVKEAWSPWKQQAGRGQTPVKRSGRSSISEARDYALPSLSPFRPPPSPSATGGLARSATTNNLRRAGSIASDISMGRQSTSNRQMKGSTSMLFGSGSVAGDRADDAMSVDGVAAERTREGSVLDWFMRDRWSKEPGSPHHQRMSSLAPSSSMPPIRKGQLVWNSEKGFVRESELKAAEAPQIQQNQAERILFALESMRKTPLEDARKLQSSSSLPASLIGSSSRQIRRAINVPLATARAGESAKSRRDKERLGGDERVSVMISPYGRRRAVDSELRERSVATEDYRHTKSPSASRSQATDHDMASVKTPTPEPPREPSPEPTPRRSSRLKRQDTTHDQEETPRSKRSTRGKGTVKTAAVETSAPKESGRRRRKATAEPMSPEPEGPTPMPSIPTITETAPSPSEKSSQSTYQPRSENDGPRQQSSLRARTEKTKRAHGSSAHGSRATSPTGGGRYSAKEEDLPDMEELEQSKIALPSFSGINFGNFGVPAPSAPKPAAPAPLSQSTDKSGTTSLGQTAASGLGVPRTGGPLSRLNATRPRASSPLAATSVIAEPDSPETKGPTPPSEAAKPDENGFFSLSGGKTTPTSDAPAPSSLFAPPKSTEGSGKPAFSFGLGKPSAPPASTTPPNESGEVPNFFGRKSAPDSGTATPIVATPAPFSFGSSAPKAAEPAKKDSSAPFSFGQSGSTTPSTTDKPTPAPLGSFNFGSSSKPADANDKPAAPGFSFGGSSNESKADKPAPAPIGSFNFGGKRSSEGDEPGKKAPAPIGSFNFGSSKPSETTDKPASGTATPSFFGSSKSADQPKPAEAAAPKFSFGSTSAAPPTAPTSTPSFSFGGSTAPASAKPEAPKTGFSFGSSSKPAEPAKPAETPKASFSFGSSSGTPSAEPVKAPEPAKPSSFSFGAAVPSTPASENKSAGFSFGQPSTTPAGNSPASGGFSFGAKSAEPAKPPASTGFSFGSSASADSKPNGSAAAPAFVSSAPSTTGSGFTFGQNGGTGGSTPSFGFGGGAGPSSQPAPAPAPAASNPFGGGQPAQSGSFGFGSGGAASNPASGFGSSNSTASPFGSAPSAAAPANNAGGFIFAFGSNNASPGFGASPAAAPAASPSFGFGQPNNAAPAPTPSTPTTAPATSFAFGASTTPNQSTFTFGASPAQNGSTTPAGQPSGFRFGSPAPGGTPPTDGGGFSLGMDSNPPGSPSGRKIKPLRRGAKR